MKKTTAAVGIALRTVMNGLKNALKASKTPPRTPKMAPAINDTQREIRRLKRVVPTARYV